MHKRLTETNGIAGIVVRTPTTNGTKGNDIQIGHQIPQNFVKFSEKNIKCRGASRLLNDKASVIQSIKNEEYYPAFCIQLISPFLTVVNYDAIVSQPALLGLWGK